MWFIVQKNGRGVKRQSSTRRLTKRESTDHVCRFAVANSAVRPCAGSSYLDFVSLELHKLLNSGRTQITSHWHLPYRRPLTYRISGNRLDQLASDAFIVLSSLSLQHVYRPGHIPVIEINIKLKDSSWLFWHTKTSGLRTGRFSGRKVYNDELCSGRRTELSRGVNCDVNDSVVSAASIDWKKA